MTTTIANGTAGSLPPSPTAASVPPNDRSHKGALVVTVLSAYDLTFSQQPTAVSLSILGQTSRTGPPSSRHKDRNSFRFVSNQTLRVEAPLSELYKSKATLTVEYGQNPRENLTATLVCKNVHIHETTWLILNLEKQYGPSSSTAASSTGSVASSGGPNDDDPMHPTLRLQVRLEGPYRTEIAALVTASNAWFGAVDAAQGSMDQVTKSLPSMDPKYILIPSVPILTAVLVLSPILLGVLVVGLPVFLPILVVVLSVLGGLTLVVSTIAASTKAGRSYIGGAFAPMYHTLLSTPSGQRLVYETGPRPTPVSIARTILPKEMWGRLLVSLAIDAIGSASYLLPVVGEGMDIAWAPIQTVMIMAMYDTVSPNLKYVSFFEELLPFTDVVPSATIGWVTEFGPKLLALPSGQGSSSGLQMTPAANSAFSAVATPNLQASRQ